MTIPHDKELNACGMNCPLPILRARKALNDMTSGQVLRIEDDATALDPAKADAQ